MHSFMQEGVCWYQWEGSRKTKLVRTSKNVSSTSPVSMGGGGCMLGEGMPPKLKDIQQF